MLLVPCRIQRKRTKGWRMPAGAMYVGRPTVFGNPYQPGERMSVGVTVWDGGRQLRDETEIPMTVQNAVDAYRALMEGRLQAAADPDPAERLYVDTWKSRVAALRGHPLVCWCPLDQPCDADLLLEMANR